MNRNSKVTPMKKTVKVPDFVKEQPVPQLPVLFTDPEVAEYGEVLATTELGCVIVKKDEKVYMFTPIAKVYGDNDNFYYQKVDFK